MTGRVYYKEGTAPGTPDSGYVVQYAKTDGRLYHKDDAGTEHQSAGDALLTEAGTGITGGTGTVYASSAAKQGSIYLTHIIVDLTGLNSSTTDGDIIGVDSTSNPCHLGQLTAVESGTLLFGRILCLETPAGGDPDIDLYSANESTGTEDTVITTLTETLLYARGGDWAAGDIQIMTALPPADDYLYLTNGANPGTDATYTAGKFLIEFYGT